MTRNEKISIRHVAAVNIIYRKKYPDNLFLDVRGPAYPFKVFKKTLLPFGGNYIGNKALTDRGTFGTVARELGEELTLEREMYVSREELTMLSGTSGLGIHSVPELLVSATSEDKMDMDRLKESIITRCRGFGDYIITIPEQMFKEGEAFYNIGDVIYLCSVWESGLNESEWNVLAELQEKFGNLSGESVTTITSLQNILDSGWQIAWGQGPILRDFLVSKQVSKAEELPLMPPTSAERAGKPNRKRTYQWYFKRYNIANVPS